MVLSRRLDGKMCGPRHKGASTPLILRFVASLTYFAIREGLAEEMGDSQDLHASFIGSLPSCEEINERSSARQKKKRERAEESLKKAQALTGIVAKLKAGVGSADAAAQSAGINDLARLTESVHDDDAAMVGSFMRECGQTSLHPFVSLP